MLTFTLLLILPTLTLAIAEENVENDLFKLLDHDGDGKISTDEMYRYFVDENKDGFVSQLEFTDNAHRLNITESAHERDLFHILDHNSDGLISNSDLDTILKLVDTDSDMGLDRHEFST
ncbi:hypothetical protein BsWGS_07064 [Bradybaena similaris]